LIEKEGKNNRSSPSGHPDKNSNKNQKNPDDMVDSWSSKSLIIFLVIALVLGGIIVIYSFLKRKRK